MVGMICRLFSGRSGDEPGRFGGYHFHLHHPHYTHLHGLWRLIEKKYPGIRPLPELEVRVFEMMPLRSYPPQHIAAYAVRKIKLGLDALEEADIPGASACLESAKVFAWAADVGTIGCFERIDHNTANDDGF